VALLVSRSFGEICLPWTQITIETYMHRICVRTACQITGTVQSSGGSALNCRFCELCRPRSPPGVQLRTPWRTSIPRPPNLALWSPRMQPFTLRVGHLSLSIL